MSRILAVYPIGEPENLTFVDSLKDGKAVMDYCTTIGVPTRLVRISPERVLSVENTDDLANL